MTPEELKAAKKKKGYTSRKLSELSGVPLGTIQKIMSGATAAPRLDTMNALERVLADPGTDYSRRPSGRSSQPQFLQDTSASFAAAPGPTPGSQSESGPAENASGLTPQLTQNPAGIAARSDLLNHTLLNEFIGGKLFSLPVSDGIHRLISCEVYRQLSDALITAGKSSGRHHSRFPAPLVCLSPFPLELPGRSSTLLFPDVFVLEGQTKIHSGRIIGVPSLIVEVTSPSTRKKDTSLKLETYVSAGVSEYWVIDPTDRSIMRCDIAHDNRIAMFTFGSAVQVLTKTIPCAMDTARFDELIRQYSALTVI